MKIALIFAALAIAANFLMMYTKKRGAKDKTPKLQDDFQNFSLNQSLKKDIDVLKKAAADELGISLEELDRMSVKEIEMHARLKELI